MLIFSPTADDVIILVSGIYGLGNCNLVGIVVKDKLPIIHGAFTWTQ